MKAVRVYWVWALLLVGIVGLAGGLTARWYAFDAETPESNNFVRQFGAEFVPPAFQLHTEFWTAGHQQPEGLPGTAGNADVFPHLAQVMGVTRVFYLVGAVGIAIATVGLLFRMRGLPDGKGVVASLAILSVMSVVGGAAYFAMEMPGAYNDYLETQRGESPEIAFITLGIDSNGGAWENATSGPRAGWLMGLGGAASITGAFVVAFSADVRRAKQLITDDTASKEHRAQRLGDHDRQGVDRFRKEGSS